MDTPALDLVISNKFLNVLCKCEQCQNPKGAFSRIKNLIQAIENRDDDVKKLEANLDGELLDEEENNLKTDQQDG